MVLSWIYVLLSLLTPVFGKSSFPLYPDYSLSYLWHKWCRGRYPFPPMHSVQNVSAMNYGILLSFTARSTHQRI